MTEEHEQLQRARAAFLYTLERVLWRRLHERRERERAEIARLEQPGNEAERREFVRRQSEGVVGFRWSPGRAIRNRRRR